MTETDMSKSKRKQVTARVARDVAEKLRSWSASSGQTHGAGLLLALLDHEEAAVVHFKQANEKFAAFGMTASFERPKSEQLNFRVTVQVEEKLEAARSLAGVDRSLFVTWVLRAWLDEGKLE